MSWYENTVTWPNNFIKALVFLIEFMLFFFFFFKAGDREDSII